jgi:hypothetical protein
MVVPLQQIDLDNREFNLGVGDASTHSACCWSLLPHQLYHEALAMLNTTTTTIASLWSAWLSTVSAHVGVDGTQPGISPLSASGNFTVASVLCKLVPASEAIVEEQLTVSELGRFVSQLVRRANRLREALRQMQRWVLGLTETSITSMQRQIHVGELCIHSAGFTRIASLTG